ncbi:rhodanese-like domain-containing protein [Arcobacter roscoffensis]|uniref:Rhodanese-like domain-containing protein n=1 Tax=Arcobacter roscoffensis TaxID=2961520 RepID=A0ABY5E4X9_9BACT|nr:rhodanese-like domain-containing protein [Arcobacter roscoffensis]UTJ07217.1 rhodanese-like domain-containing protein [Arcobacter roscoffensis]
MFRFILLLVSLSLSLFAVKPEALQYSGFEVTHTYSNNTKEKYTIERKVDGSCIGIGVSPYFFDESYIKEDIDESCKKVFITTTGAIQNNKIDKDIKNLGENELMHFIYSKSTKNPDKYILVDSRNKAWFDFATIPSAVNIYYDDLKYDFDFEEDFYRAYKTLGVKVIDDDKFDFTNAKTAVFFCNGAWCPLSSKSIRHLINIGYPKDKLLWYRGGVHAWSMVALPLTKKLKE